MSYDIVVCGSIVPDPLQTLTPMDGPQGPALKNEMMLPAVLDPWAGHALFEAANLARTIPGCRVWLVSLWSQGQIAAGHDGRGPKGPVPVRGRGRPFLRFHGQF